MDPQLLKAIGTITACALIKDAPGVLEAWELIQQHLKRDGWLPWDENNPPAPGEYVVYHSRFRHPGEKVWTFRAANNGKFWGEDKVRWSYKKGQCVWFNEGNWQADGPPEWYRPMPVCPFKELKA